MENYHRTWRSKLLRSIQENDIVTFETIFEQHKFSNKTCNSNFWSTCLEKAANTENGEEFLRVMFKYGIRFRKNFKFKDPIHIAAASGQLSVLKVLLKHPKSDVNVIDSQGRTALHHLVINFPKDDNEDEATTYEKCLALLICKNDIDVNKPNKKGYTPLHEAVNYGNERCVRSFLNLAHGQLDVDSFRALGKTARDDLSMKYPSLKYLLPDIGPKNIKNIKKLVEDLFISLRKKRLKEFVNIVYATDIKRNPLLDLNATYNINSRCRTFLIEACSISDREDFVKVLLNVGVDVNIQESSNGKSALHVAVETDNVNSLNLLLGIDSINVNPVDFRNRTPLHYAVQREDSNSRFSCTVNLLRHPKININAIDVDGCTAIYLAAKGNDESIIKILLTHSPNIDIICEETLTNARKLLNQNFPVVMEELKDQLNKYDNKFEVKEYLTKCLFESRYDDFIRTFKDHVKSDIDLLDCNIGEETFLQYACRKGIKEVVKIMLKCGANPNLIKYGNRSPPFVLACQMNHSDLIPYFLRSHDDVKFDINAADINGNTGLYYAAANENVDLVYQFLKHGADIKIVNVYEKQPISSHVMELLLDYCLKVNSLPQNDPDFEVTFDYSAIISDQNEPRQISGVPEDEIWLRSGDIERNAPNQLSKKSNLEMDFFEYLSESNQHQHLLQHPLVSMFLDVKWIRIRMFFYVKFSLYIAFVLLLNTYVILCDLKLRQKYLKDNFTESYNETSENFETRNSSLGLRIFMSVAYLILLLATLADTCITIYKIPLALIKPCKVTSGTQIFKQIFTLSHLLDFSVNIFTSVFLYHLKGQHVQELAAVIIVLGSWTKLVLLLGNFSKLSTNIKLIQDVLHRYVPYLLSYTLLIIGFAFSFYILFDDDGFFSNPGTAIFKAAVMMMGEFNLTEKQLSLHPGISHIVFLFFMILIVIMMLNILSIFLDDAQALRNKAKVVRLISRVELMTDIEHLLTKVRKTRCVWYILSTNSHIRRWFRRIPVFSNIRNSKKIHVMPNREGKIMICDVVEGYEVDKETVQDVMKRLNPEMSDLSKIREILEKHSQILLELKKS